MLCYIHVQSQRVCIVGPLLQDLHGLLLGLIG